MIGKSIMVTPILHADGKADVYFPNENWYSLTTFAQAKITKERTLKIYSEPLPPIFIRGG